MLLGEVDPVDPGPCSAAPAHPLPRATPRPTPRLRLADWDGSVTLSTGPQIVGGWPTWWNLASDCFFQVRGVGPRIEECPSSRLQGGLLAPHLWQRSYQSSRRTEVSTPDAPHHDNLLQCWLAHIPIPPSTAFSAGSVIHIMAPPDTCRATGTRGRAPSATPRSQQGWSSASPGTPTSGARALPHPPTPATTSASSPSLGTRARRRGAWS